MVLHIPIHPHMLLLLLMHVMVDCYLVLLYVARLFLIVIIPCDYVTFFIELSSARSRQCSPAPILALYGGGGAMDRPHAATRTFAPDESLEDRRGACGPRRRHAPADRVEPSIWECMVSCNCMSLCIYFYSA